MHTYKRIVFLCLVMAFGFCGHFVSAKECKSPSVFDPNYNIKPRRSLAEGLNVVRGETQVIIPEHKSYCPVASVFKFNNGDIQVLNRRSSNGGESWHLVDCNINTSAYQYPEPNGEVVMFSGELAEVRPEVIVKKAEQRSVYEVNFLRSKNNGLTYTKDTAIINLPKKYEDYSRALCGKIVGLADGGLLMSMYCYEYLDDGKGKKVEGKSRTIIIHSTDRGKTWNYLSTVAFDLIPRVTDERVQTGLPTLRHWGFEEPCLLAAPNGRIFCFMRSGSGYRLSLSDFNKETPLYMSISNDGGKSWSNADAVAPFGVWPGAVMMKNGVMVVNYGRPGNWLMASKDEGKSWGPIFCFYQDLYPPDCGNYFTMAEVAEDTLLVVYARTNPNDSWLNEIVGTYFFVKRI